MCEPRHERPGIQIVDPFLEQPDGEHLAVHAKELVGTSLRTGFTLSGWGGHAVTPDMRASTLYRMAKSCSPRPCARADDRNSLTMAPVGSDTCSSRPSSSASVMSFCIMFALNAACSGIFRTHGPLYCTSGDAT